MSCPAVLTCCGIPWFVPWLNAGVCESTAFPSPKKNLLRNSTLGSTHSARRHCLKFSRCLPTNHFAPMIKLPIDPVTSLGAWQATHIGMAVQRLAADRFVWTCWHSALNICRGVTGLHWSRFLNSALAHRQPSLCSRETEFDFTDQILISIRANLRIKDDFSLCKIYESKCKAS